MIVIGGYSETKKLMKIAQGEREKKKEKEKIILQGLFILLTS